MKIWRLLMVLLFGLTASVGCGRSDQWVTVRDAIDGDTAMDEVGNAPDQPPRTCRCSSIAPWSVDGSGLVRYRILAYGTDGRMGCRYSNGIFIDAPEINRFTVDLYVITHACISEQLTKTRTAQWSNTFSWISGDLLAARLKS
jgi:hypothetical protein